MLTMKELSRLERRLRGTGTLTVYVGRATDDPARRDDWRIALDNAIDAARESIAPASHEERERFERAVERLLEALAAPDGPRTAGWLGFVTPERVAYAESTSVALPTHVAWGERIEIAPYLRLIEQRRAAAIAVVDAAQARIYRYQAGSLEPRGVVHAHPHGAALEHMGTPAAPGFHAGTRGETGTDAAEHARVVARDRMLGEVARKLTELAGRDGWILVGGIPEVAAIAVGHLDDDARPRARALDSVDVHATQAQLTARALAASAELNARARAAAVDAVLDLYASGAKASRGDQGTREALRERAVEELLVSERFVRADARAAEDIVREALEQDADVVYVHGTAADRLDAVGGIAARLRFQPVHEQAPVGGRADAAP